MRRNAALHLGTWLLAGTIAAGCGGNTAAPRAVHFQWCAAHAQPAFDPDGPPDPLRVALERLLSRGLVGRDSTGHIVLDAADSTWTSADGRTVTLRLRPDLRFTDGTPVTSGDFRTALLAGLGRDDHATRAWLLAPVAGVDRVRAGRPLPAVGLESPDVRTLVLRLSRPDPGLLARLASPGVGAPFKRRAGIGWDAAIGIGPYRVLAADAVRGLTFARLPGVHGAAGAGDTVSVRFVIGGPRVRALLRHHAVDLVWPLPPALGDEPLPDGYAAGERAAQPPRRLLLVLRADVPPTTKLPARHALAHALNREALLAALGLRAAGQDGWLDGGGAFDHARLDAGEVRQWLARGHLGASFHVVLAYDADGTGGAVARALQGQWSALGLYAELRPLRGPQAAAEPLHAAAAQAQLVETQAPLPGAAAELATLVMPLRGPAIGSVRTGWRTREFDHWIGGADPPEPLDAAAAQARLAEERVVLPLAKLPWRWLARTGAPPLVRFSPAYGPDFTGH